MGDNGLKRLIVAAVVLSVVNSSPFIFNIKDARYYESLRGSESRIRKEVEDRNVYCTQLIDIGAQCPLDKYSILSTVQHQDGLSKFLSAMREHQHDSTYGPMWPVINEVIMFSNCVKEMAEKAKKECSDDKSVSSKAETISLLATTASKVMYEIFNKKLAELNANFNCLTDYNLYVKIQETCLKEFEIEGLNTAIECAGKVAAQTEGCSPDTVETLFGIIEIIENELKHSGFDIEGLAKMVQGSKK